MPKYAILSDIHGNSAAFESVLARCAQCGVDKYICLGDIVGYNAEPARCMDIARSLNFAAAVRGNHDDYAVREDLENSGFNKNAKIAIQWTRDQLSPEQLEYLANLPMQQILRECNATFVHATLDTPESWGYVFDDHHAGSNFSYQFTRLAFCGHSHIPVAFDKSPLANGNRRPVEKILAWENNLQYPEADTDFSLCDELQIQLEKGHKYLFNIGSIGQPRNGDTRASFAILDTDNDIVSRHRVPYDIADTQQKVLDAGLPTRLAERLGIGH